MASSGGGDGSSAARAHIESLRRERFYIGKDQRNPLAEDIHQAVNYLSEELYAKDVHFLMELIQNAEDNEYPDGVAPSLEFVITSKDITATGAESTLLVFNNERGFSPANIESLCRVGKSTKKGNRHRGYIGEKGIGFKSVFLISSQPYIFSNGYKIKFNEEACPECDIGYIVPEWVEENPNLSDIQAIYGSRSSLPTTTIILPLKRDKVLAVKQQLSKMSPEILLFLSKIKQLSIREHNDDSKHNTVSQISISKETDFQTRKNMDAESYTLHLAAQKNVKGEEEECSYYMWKQKFPVNSDSRVKKRMEVDEWMITLAFPYGQRLNRGMMLPGVYAFLPTEMLTNFPFIIQADFLLASSRESILWDSPWNKGILNCIPSAFVNAFVSLVKSTISAPSFSIPPLFEFLPVFNSPIPLMNLVRLSIKEKVVSEHIIPCESYTGQKIFCKPHEVRRLLPAFWDILIKARKNGVNLENLSSHGTYILSSSFDMAQYDNVLEFLGVQPVDKEWYGKCIESSNLAREVSEELYLELLYFLAERWNDYFHGTNMQRVPLLKYQSTKGTVCLWSIERATRWEERVCIASDNKYISWLINWNVEFASVANRFFMPKDTQMMLNGSTRRATIMDWLKKYVKLDALDVHNYGELVVNSLSNRRDVIAFTHFLFHSVSKNYISEWGCRNTCSSMPVVDNYGNVTARRTEVLVPAKGSKWVGLIGSNPWRAENYVELGADYMSSFSSAGILTSENKLLSFLKDYIQVCDIPDIRPPDAAFPTVSSPLIKENVFLLLEWIRNLRHSRVSVPQKFLTCIKCGSWLKTSVGYKPPSDSFLSNSGWGSLLQMTLVLIDIPMIDQEFYGSRLSDYKEELKTIGVRFKFGEASTYIGSHLMSLAANSSLPRGHVFSLLKLIRFLREKNLPPNDLIKSIKDERWLKTSHHYRSPVGSILFNSEWATAKYISNLPFIDNDFYGEDILNYKTELELLGVITSFNHNHQLVINNFKMATTSIPADAAILLLECIRYARSSESLFSKIREIKWLKTQLGYNSPTKSFFADSEWQCLIEVVDGVPFLDETFYGSRIKSYKEELKKAGVVVRFEEASKAIAHQIKKLLSSSSFAKKNVLALLACYRQLKVVPGGLSADLLNCIHNEKWLNTTLGFRSPRDSILFDLSWEDISPIATLPFIDHTDACYGKEIYEYRDELNALGATVEFKDGAKFVVTGLNIPKNSSSITPRNVFSLLKCIKSLKKSRMESLPTELINSINKKWLKTVIGYRSPGDCILFDSKWSSFLQREDGPFIDEAFYGSEIASYRDELKEIGVVVDVENGCSLVADHLKHYCKISVIVRIYDYLREFKWEPDNKSADWIWIPNGSEAGEWVSSSCCVLRDKDNLFGSELHVLEKHYGDKLLGFFSMVLGVEHGPTVDSYCKLWNVWENSLHPLTIVECSAFWVFIAKHWNAPTKKLLMESLTKLPVCTEGVISLSNKKDVFIPDDLLLKDLFDEVSQESIFIWYPDTCLPQTSRAKMNNIYKNIGVQTISEVIEKDESSSSEGTNFKEAGTGNTVIKNGLLRIILGFLADPSLDICGKERHQIVKYLLDISIFETDVPLTVHYGLVLTSGITLTVNASRILRWERENAKLFMQNIDMSCGMKAKIEFATYFSEVIAKGLLFDRADQIGALTELTKIACLLDFEDAAVKFLLKTKNLQLFVEDEEFLSSAFCFSKA